MHFLICCESVQNLVIIWRLLHWFQNCPPGWVPFISTLPWVGIFISYKSAQGVSLNNTQLEKNDEDGEDDKGDEDSENGKYIEDDKYKDEFEDEDEDEDED